MLGLCCCMGEQGLHSSYGARASHCDGFSCCGAQALWLVGSVVVKHRISCSAACGIFPDLG